MIKITDENRSDLIASCLMEAANIMKENNNKPMEESVEILEEGAANKAAKKIKNSIDKSDRKLNDFYNGSLTKEEGKEVYRKAMEECDKYVKQIKAIPDEQFSDKIQNTLKTMFAPGTVFTVGLHAVIAILTGWKSILIGAGLGTIVGSTLVGSNISGDTEVNGKRSFTKTEVLSKLNSFRIKISNIYNSYYKD